MSIETVSFPSLAFSLRTPLGRRSLRWPRSLPHGDGVVALRAERPEVRRDLAALPRVWDAAVFRLISVF